MATPRGIDLRQSGDRIVFRASLKDSAGAKVTSGSSTLSLYELQQDGSLKSYDFADNTFKSTALTTATAALTHRTGNNGTANTGIWTYALTTVSGLTRGGVYIAQVSHSSASPTEQEREFQYGNGEGDFGLDAAGNPTVGGYASGQDPAALTGVTPTRGPKLDNLDAAVSSVAASVWGYATRTLTSASGVAADLWGVLTGTLTGAGTIGAALARLGSGAVAIRAGYAAGTLVLRQGDSYTTAGGSTLAIDKPAGAAYPADLTGWTVTLHARAKADTTGTGSTSFTSVLSVPNPATTQEVVINALAAATTDTLVAAVNGWEFSVVATKGSDQTTLFSGVLSVLPKVV